MKTLSRYEIRELDRRAIEEFDVPGIVLMENAGRGVVDFFLSLNLKGPVVICCGKGNNGGDGFVVARHLDNHDIPVSVLLFAPSEDLRGDAEINYNILVKSGVYIVDCSDRQYQERFMNELSRAEWVIDALLGTGLSGEVKAPYDHIIEIINHSSKKIIAIDIPSGLDCDTGKPLGKTIKANYTVTFAALKKGFVLSEAKEYIGTVHLVDIGVPKVVYNL